MYRPAWHLKAFLTGFKSCQILCSLCTHAGLVLGVLTVPCLRCGGRSQGLWMTHLSRWWTPALSHRMICSTMLFTSQVRPDSSTMSVSSRVRLLSISGHALHPSLPRCSLSATWAHDAV